jgi:Transposase DDE domain/Transposase domain (DUF772)
VFWGLIGQNHIHVVLVLGGSVTVGIAPSQGELLKGTAGFCEGRVGGGSVWALLHRECHRLFGDELFADLFAATGRRSVPPRVVATVMVLQRLFGLSDREAVEAFEFDTRWKYACGGLPFDYPGFAHTVLVDMRARLARSERPDRIRDVVIDAARDAGLVGVRRVLDSTPLYDAVATMDTVTLVRSAMRALLKVADAVLAAELRGLLGSGDDYFTTAKPQIDWDDQAARDDLIGSRAKDAFACLGFLDGRDLSVEVAEAARLLATVVGQDLEQTDDGTFRIARRVAADRVISTVDPDARHGHKTAARGFDGYKGHVSVDPDSEIITNSTVSAGNVADGAVAGELVGELVDYRPPAHPQADDNTPAKTVYGDSAYGSGEVLADLNAAGVDPNVKTPRPQAPDGHFTKDNFDINLEHGTVTCPAGVTVGIGRGRKGPARKEKQARFGQACATCPLRDQCTSSANGRVVTVGSHEPELAENRRRQREPARAADYRATRPKVERKLGHLVRRRHGGRRARVRGKPKVTADFNLLVAAVNLARLAVLGLYWEPATGWAAA